MARVRAVPKNPAKGESYKVAWQRIANAQKEKFYLEAIVIEESIISDRLISYLSRPTAHNPLKKSAHGRWPEFGCLVTEWRKAFPNGLAVKGFDNLPEAVDLWRDARNEAVHAIAKSDPGMPTVDVEVFLSRARLAAENGADLARAVSSWQRSAGRHNKRLERTAEKRGRSAADR